MIDFRQDICAAMIYLCDDNYAIDWDNIYLYWARKTEFSKRDVECALAAIDHLPEDVDALDLIFHVVHHFDRSGKLLEQVMARALRLHQPNVLLYIRDYCKHLSAPLSVDFCEAFYNYLSTKTTWMDRFFDRETILFVKRRCNEHR